MKKALCLFLTLVLALLALSSCNNKYKPQKSTAEEDSTVFVLTVGENEYEVKYELYRWLFLSHRDSVDGGDKSVWSGADKNSYIAKMNAKILSYATEIYAAFEIAERIGFDIYSDEVEDTIQSYIVEGGDIDGEYYPGCGSYDDYLELLRENYMNYAVQVLLFRYALAIEAIDKYYIGAVSQDDISSDNMTAGTIKYTRDDVRDFYFGDDSVRVLRHFIQDGIKEDTKGYADEVRDKINSAAPLGHDAVVNVIMGNSNLAAPTEVRQGVVIGRYNLERAYYSEMTEYAFALYEGGVSPAFLVEDTESSGYYILYKAEKTEEHFAECYNSILYVFLKDKVGEVLHGVENELMEKVGYTDFYSNLDHSKIGM